MKWFVLKRKIFPVVIKWQEQWGMNLDPVQLDHLSEMVANNLSARWEIIEKKKVKP